MGTASSTATYWCPSDQTFKDEAEGTPCERPDLHLTPSNWPYEDAVFAHPITRAHRIPVVRSERPVWRYHVALILPDEQSEDVFDYHAVEPETQEIAMLGSYLEFWLSRYYNERWLRKMRAAPADIDSGTITRTFIKRRDDDPTYPERLTVEPGTATWHYRVSTWEHSIWPFPYVMRPEQREQKSYQPFTSLVGLLDHIEHSDSWTQWKGAHPQVFPAEASVETPAKTKED